MATPTKVGGSSQSLASLLQQDGAGGSAGPCECGPSTGPSQHCDSRGQGGPPGDGEPVPECRHQRSGQCWPPCLRITPVLSGSHCDWLDFLTESSLYQDFQVLVLASGSADGNLCLEHYHLTTVSPCQGWATWCLNLAAT